MTAEILSTLISDLKWPVVIIVALILLRRPLREAFGRLTKLNITAGKFKLETSLKGHVSPEVLKQLSKNPDQFRLGAENREITILHSVTRGYSTIGEAYSPEEVFASV
jgi:hypothetical protein